MSPISCAMNAKEYMRLILRLESNPLHTIVIKYRSWLRIDPTISEVIYEMIIFKNGELKTKQLSKEQAFSLIEELNLTVSHSEGHDVVWD